MDDQEIIDRIRTAFETHDMTTPVEALTNRARSRRSRGRIIASAILVVGVAGALVVAIPRGDRPAFGWTPQPVEPSPGVDRAVEDACRRVSDPLPPIVVIDQRGDAAMGFYADDTKEVNCFVRNEGGSWSSDHSTGSGNGFCNPCPSSILHVDGSSDWPGWKDDQGIHADISALWGRAFSPQVARVEIVLDDGTTLETSFARGFFVAWWPFHATATEITAFDSSGNVVVRCGYSEMGGDDCHD